MPLNHYSEKAEMNMKRQGASESQAKSIACWEIGKENESEGPVIRSSCPK